jgi:hypothetical protein
MRGNRIDANQKEVVDALRSVGALWVSTSGDPQVGFDGICCFRSRVFLVEIKDGKKPASRRRLTDGEAARMDDLKRQGVRLHVWESADSALRAIGAIK